MSTEFKLDQTDLTILRLLQDNSDITNAQLAKEVGLSPAPTLERVKKLESAGIIKSYHAELDKSKLGLGVTIFIMLSLSSHKKHQIQAFVDKMEEIPEVMECHHITGAGDFLLKIITEDMASYQQLILDKLIDVEEIGNMQSNVVLSTYKDSKVLPVKQ